MTRIRFPRRLALSGGAVLVILGTAASPAHAQRTDDEWLENCRDQQRRDREAHCMVKVDRVRAGESLRVDAGQNGGVLVYGADRTDVEVHARVQAWAESAGDAESLAGAVRLNYEPGSIRADGPSAGRREGWAVTFVVYVPRRTDLDLQASNGPVSAADVMGTITATTRNGPVSLRSVGGDVTARTENGPITVDLEGDRWDGAGLDAQTRNGPINLRIPEGYNARLEAGTVNGPFNTDVPLQVTLLGRQRNRRVEATLGDGGPLIRAVTTNGPVNIRRE
jgi:hypothetical protein